MGFDADAHGLMSAGRRVERAWRVGNLAWWLVLAGGTFSVALTATAALAWQRLAAKEVATRVQAAFAAAPLDQQALPQKNTPSTLAHADFVRTLPDAVDTQPILVVLRQAAIEAGTELAGVQLQQRAGATEILARADLTASLRGSHPKLKQVLAEILGRYPNATLSHLMLRRVGSPEQLEATMVISVWGAPMGAAVATSVPTMETR